MKKLFALVALFLATLPAAAETAVFKLSLWDHLALATPANTQDVTGVDFGIMSNTATVTGVQLDLLIAQTQYELKGLSSAWIVSMVGETYGAQAALLTKTEKLTGAQLGVVNMVENSGTGVQWGFFNKAEFIHGAQLGFVNYARTIEGLQIGLINIAENGWFPAMVFVNGRF